MMLALLPGLGCPSAYARKNIVPPVPVVRSGGLIDNVNGLAIDAQGHLVHFTGLTLDKEGKVERRLSAGDPRPSAPEFRLDGRGRTLIPAFVDANVHIMRLGLRLMTLDLSDAGSLADAKARITRYKQDNQGRKWLLGGGWNAERWGLNRAPSPADLDGVTGEVPTWLESADGEDGWANSAALRAAGIAKAAGPLTPAQIAQIRRAIPAPTPRDRDLALEKAQQLLLARGIGTIADMGTTIEDWQTLRRAGDHGALRLRVIAYASGIEQMVAIAGPEPTPWLYDDRLRMVGVHFALDGSLSARNAWLKTSYASASMVRGAPFIAATPLRNQMSRAAMDGFQIAITAHGDAAVGEAVAAFEEMSATYGGDRRWRIEGADVIDPADIPRFAALGVMASVQPGRLDPEQAIAKLGQARSSRLSPLTGLETSGTRIAFGSAAPETPPLPFATLAAARSAGLTFGDSFVAATRGAAHAAFAENKVGALEAGQRADFVLIDRDISLARPDEVAATQVLESWIGGRRVYVNEAAR